MFQEGGVFSSVFPFTDDIKVEKGCFGFTRNKNF